MAGERIRTYLGPKDQIQPEVIHRYDNGAYVAEEKHDGCWCELTTDHDGTIRQLRGRSGKHFTQPIALSLIGQRLKVHDSVLVGELEVATEAATMRQNPSMYLFDAVYLMGQDITRLPMEQRRALLELAAPAQHPILRLVRRVTKGFSSFFNEVTSAGGEGVVLKRVGRPYVLGGNKTDNWIRCKRLRHVDYVVLEVGKSEGGSDNLQVGLYDMGRLTRVATIKNLPKGFDPHSVVGRVIECVGAEVHRSGALRHGHYLRTRNDKRPTECTLEAALVA